MDLPNPNRLDPSDAAGIALFADTLSITNEQLLEIIAKVGPMRPAIRFYVARSSGKTNRGTARDASPRTPQPAPAQIEASTTVQPHSLFAGPARTTSSP